MKMKRIRFEMENFGPWEIDVAPTVYPLVKTLNYSAERFQN